MFTEVLKIGLNMEKERKGEKERKNSFNSDTILIV